MRIFTRLSSLLAGIMLAGMSSTMTALPPDISVTPAPGSTVEKIETIKVTSGWLTPRGETATILVDGRTFTTNVVSDTYETLIFTLKEPVVTKGTHQITFPEKTFLIGWEDDDSPQFSYELIVDNDLDNPGENPGDDTILNQIPEGYTVSPAPGAEIDVLSTISVSSDSHIFLMPKIKAGITINGEPQEAVHTVKGDYENTIVWTLAKPVTKAGTYNIQIPAGAFYDLQEEDNEPFLFTVKVLGGEAPAPELYPADITCDPADGSTVKELKKFAVMYPKLTSVYVGPEAEAATVTKGSDTYDAPFSFIPDEDSFNDPHVMWVELEQPLTMAGTYTFHFPEQCFVVSKYPVYKYSAPFTVSFTVDPDHVAIDRVDADDTPAEYFTPAGVKVAKPSAPGLYIVRRGAATTKEVIR